MKKITHISTRLWFFPTTLLVLLLTYGCTVQYVAEYDATIRDEIVRVAKNIDKFYGELLETAMDKRQYSDFKGRYIEIETDLRSLELRNEVRAFNKESTVQVQKTLRLWQGDMQEHKKNNSVDDETITLHRKQFNRAFVAMTKGEEIKQP